jgi:hypothetical protein
MASDTYLYSTTLNIEISILDSDDPRQMNIRKVIDQNGKVVNLSKRQTDAIRRTLNGKLNEMKYLGGYCSSENTYWDSDNIRHSNEGGD